MRVLVLGGTGFIGQHVLAELNQRNWEGVAAGRSAQGLGRLDATCRDNLKGFFRENRFDAVVNLLGKIDQGTSADKYLELLSTILIPSVNLVEALWEYQDVPLVHVGTNAEYGDAPVPQGSGSLCRPTSAYGAIKFAATNVVQTKARAEKKRARIVRPFFVYGRGAPASNFVELVARAAVDGGEFRTSPGQQTRDMISAPRVARLIVDCIESSDVQARIVNACTGRERTIRSVVEMAASLSGGAMRPNFGAIPVRLGELMNSRGEAIEDITQEEADAELYEYMATRVAELKGSRA